MTRQMTIQEKEMLKKRLDQEARSKYLAEQNKAAARTVLLSLKFQVSRFVDTTEIKPRG